MKTLELYKCGKNQPNHMRSFFMNTERLSFSTWNEKDEALANDLWGDPKVTEHISSTGIFTMEQVKERLRTEIINQKQYGVQYWPIFDKSFHFVGCCGLRPYKMEEKIYELGFHFKSSCWGKGYGTEAAKAAIDFAYNTLYANRLFAGHNPQNIASAKVLKKLGFRYSHDEFYPPTGLNHPSYFHYPNEKSGCSPCP